MKYIYGQKISERNKENESYFQCGDFRYRIHPFWAEWPKELDGEEIAAAYCDSRDNVYVLARTKKMPIAVFAPDGSFLRSLRPDFPGRLHGMTINKKDQLLCADDLCHVIFKIDNVSGEVLKVYGTRDKPSDSGYYDAYSAKRKAEGVPDTEFFDFGEQLEMNMETIQRAAPPYNKPTRMIEAPSGELFCSDGYGNAAIHRMTAEGELIRTWGGPGREPGHFRLPHGIWVDRREQVWVADRENSRVQVFTTDGELIGIADGLLRPAELWCDGDIMYIGELDGGVTLCDLDLNIVAQIGYYQSPIKCHGICGNTNADLFFTVNPPCLKMPFYSPCGLIKLERLR